MVEVLYDNEIIEVEVIGYTGLAKNPIVLINDEQYVAQLCYVDNTESVIAPVCQQKRCKKCIRHGDAGCRHNPVAYLYDKMWVVWA